MSPETGGSMSSTPEIVDRDALLRNRARAMRMAKPADFLHRLALDEVKERLDLVNTAFTKPAIVTGFPKIWSSVFPGALVVPDDDTLDLQPGTHDLIIHAMSMHWSNDPVGQLIQSRRALKPDGLFLGVLLGGQTLNELRTALAEAESQVTGGLSPRVAPMGEIRDLGDLLQRAGFALPVADNLSLQVNYRSARHLMHDLRAMGEANALKGRHRQSMPRAVLDRAEDIYAVNFPGERGGIRAIFDLIFLTGWSPDASQPKPLRPGSATTRLADALGVEEAKPDDMSADADLT